MATYRDVMLLTDDARGLRDRLLHLADDLEKQFEDRLTDQAAGKLLFRSAAR